MTEYMPDGRGRAARIALAVLAGALGTALVAGGLWMAFRPKPSSVTQTDIEPAEPTAPETSTPVPTSTPSAEETASGSDGGGTGGGGDATGAGNSATDPDGPKRVAKVAFRLGQSLYVADEDGSDAAAVLRSSAGPYALSPDAATLAVVEGGRLKLLDVASGSETDVGPAASTATPCWFADSSRVIYRRRASGTVEGFKLFSADRKGGKPESLAAGQQAAVSPDGRVVVVLATDEVMADGSGYVQVSVDGSKFRPVRVGGGMPTAVATNGKRVFVGVSDGERGSGVISMKPDGRDANQIVGAVTGATPAMWGAMCVSPDSATLGLAAQGDDGYSRTFVVPSAGGQPIGIATRRDSYLHGWSAAGDRLFLIEGNAFQGETTSLVSVSRNGTGRRMVVSGAE